MEVHKKYVVYEFNRLLGSDNHLALQKVQFSGGPNNFETEDEAIAALIHNKKTYEDYVILKQVYIN